MLKTLLLDYLFFLKHRKRFWLLPYLLILLGLGIVAYIADDSAIAPLIYAD